MLTWTGWQTAEDGEATSGFVATLVEPKLAPRIASDWHSMWRARFSFVLSELTLFSRHGMDPVRGVRPPYLRHQSVQTSARSVPTGFESEAV